MREQRDPEHEETEHAAHDDEGDPAVARLGSSEGADGVRDGLEAGKGRAAVSDAPEDHDDRGEGD